MDHPILFSAPMVRALLDGRKTQTRRLIKQPCDMSAPSGCKTVAEYCTGSSKHGLAYYWRGAGGGWNSSGPIPIKHCIGDRLWIREAHYLTDDGESEYAVYAADQSDVDEHLANMQTTMASHPDIDWSRHLRLRPSIHMPRWASRLTLTVTDVRVQRLQDISMEDSIAEGCLGYVSHDGEDGETPQEEFHGLWNSIHGPDAWDANPWVVATTFTTHPTNIDAQETPQ